MGRAWDGIVVRPRVLLHAQVTHHGLDDKVQRGCRRPLVAIMTDEAPQDPLAPEQPPFDEAEYRRRQRSRANLMGWILGGLAFLFFFITLARMVVPK